MLFGRLAFGALVAQSVAATTESGFLERVDPSMELCSVVEEALKSNYRADTTERLKVLQNDLRSSFQALPKTRYGHLAQTSTRYLLHRHFLRSRAWLVQGLAPSSVPWNASSSPVDILDNSTVEKNAIKDKLERRIKTRGLDLSEVAMLAAAIENQMHQDSIARLRKAWHAQQLPNVGTVNQAWVELVLDTYMMSYIIHSEKALEPSRVAKALARVSDIYPNWNLAQNFVRSTLRQSRLHGQEQFSFADVEHVVVEISEHYGQFQFDECRTMKLDLLALEGHRPGRVSLRNFFDQALNHDKYQFGESVAYMRHVGILDETDANNPSIIVPNYIDSPSQYVAFSDNYAVTCVDECDQLLLEIEKKVAAPHASPQRLAQIVADIASETQVARTDGLSLKLQRRLEVIAQQDGRGRVNLHGRLFAQWLHHAYPRECPYPHPSSAGMESMLPGEFCDQVGKDAAYASKDEMQSYATMSVEEHDVHDQELPWDQTEELIVPFDYSREPLLPRAAAPWLQFLVCVTLVLGFLPQIKLLKRSDGKLQRSMFAEHSDDKRLV